MLSLSLLLLVAPPSNASYRAQLCQQNRPLFERLAKFHTGPGPCLRHVNSCIPEPDPSAVKRVSNTLFDAQITPEMLMNAMAMMKAWAKDAEANHHQASAREEMMTSLLAAIPAKRHAEVRPQLEKQVSLLVSDPTDTPEDRARFHALTKGEQDLMRKAWSKYAVELTLFLPQHLEALRGAINQRTLRRFAETLQAHHRTHHHFPSPDQVKLPTDAYGDPLMYRTEGDTAIVGIQIESIDQWLLVSADRITPYTTDQPPLECELADGHTYTLSPDLSARLKSDPAAALQDQARIIPNFVKGQFQGFKVLSIRPESYFAQACLQDGDIITQLDDTALTSLKEARAFMNPATFSRAHTYRVLRDGQAYKIRVRLHVR